MFIIVVLYIYYILLDSVALYVTRDFSDANGQKMNWELR